MDATRVLLLIVEDDPDLRMSISESLIVNGYEVVTASDGQEAIEQLRRGRLPDLILSDVMMPRMDGFELLRRIRSEPKWVAVPFVFLTARTESGEVVHGKSLGAEDYVVKPFKYEELLPLIAARINRSRELARGSSEQADDVRKNILRLINHEFRTPLTTIVAYSNMLKDLSERELSGAELTAYLKHIGGGAQRLHRLVENFVLLMELGYPEMPDINAAQRLRRIDAPEFLLRDAVAAVGRPVDRHHFEYRVDPTLSRFTADRETLLIAMRELVDNAVKFSPAGSTVTLSAKRCDPEIRLSVTDHGCGIPAAARQHLTEPFYQVDRAGREQQGTGTGLTIVRAIAALHRGRLEFESVENEGSCFTLILPADYSALGSAAQSLHTP